MTRQSDKSIIHFNNDICHIDKENCQAEGLKILRNRLKEHRAALNVNPQEMGRLFAVIPLALTIVCGVTVEDVFYLQEETKNET